MNKLLLITAALTIASCTRLKNATMITTTEKEVWITQKDIAPLKSSRHSEIIIDHSKVKQTIDGFGTCFNELGWTSLNQLNPGDREIHSAQLWSRRSSFSSRYPDNSFQSSSLKLIINLQDFILYQTATFRPLGLWGRLYWYSVLPLHGFILRGMIQNIAGV
jgi:hypothetical protein